MPSRRPRLRNVALATLAGAFVTGAFVACSTTYPAGALSPPAIADRTTPPAHVGVSVVLTSRRIVRESLLDSGGSAFKLVDTNFSAFLVKHDDRYVLFDTGLGSQIDAQYAADMPRWNRLFFTYDPPVVPVRKQLDDAKLPPVERIFLSHAHWDHASGLADFAGTPIWVPREEMAMIDHPRAVLGGAWPSQVAGGGLTFHPFTFDGPPVEGFATSLDLFGDGTVVAVPLFGHTPGSIGLFVTVDSGKRYLFCGDTVWRADTVTYRTKKSWPARALVDADGDATARTVAQLHDLAAKDPSLVIVPAHDGDAQRKLGFFPAWAP